MKLTLSVLQSNDVSEHVLSSVQRSHFIQINELDFVFLFLELPKLVLLDNLSLTIGNTVFQFDDPIEISDKYFYQLKFERIKALLPGIDSHITETYYETAFGKRRFYRLFLNEIGFSNFYLNVDDENFFLGKVEVASSKITQENFALVTQYLILNNYFDSNFLYKVIVEGENSSINNSLIEALRRLIKMLKSLKNKLQQFRKDPIYSLSTSTSIVPFNENLEISSTTIDWLIQNSDNIISNGTQYSTSFTKAEKVAFKNVLIETPYRSFDSYENRIIHGFLIALYRLIIDKETIINKRAKPSTRISSFRDYLIQCFHTIISNYFRDLKYETGVIKRFFETEIKVSYPIYEFPTKVDGFFSKQHYSEIFNVISSSRNIFAIEFGNENFSLEIESFDKLFEVYCFYLLKDILISKFKLPLERIHSYPSDNNKDAGIYQLKIKEIDLQISLYYEGIPDSWRQFVSGRALKPDFIITFTKNSSETSILFDAKFKNYSRSSRLEDFETLALKYLHKIGPIDTLTHKVKSLISISLGVTNKRNHFYSAGFDLRGLNPIFPHIANVEIDPKSFNIESNHFSELIDIIIEGMG